MSQWNFRVGQEGKGAKTREQILSDAKAHRDARAFQKRKAEAASEIQRVWRGFVERESILVQVRRESP
jgi:hypothetical protein